jgi:hypothetical protein
MTIALVSLVIKHERRVQLLFSTALGASAFTSASLYSATNIDGSGASPTIVAVYMVANSPHAVELALGCDLVPGGRYEFTANGVPALDGAEGVTPTPSTTVGTFGNPTVAAQKQKGGTSELEALLYGVDLLFANGDFVEAASGDLDTISGAPNLSAALYRRLFSDGLAWDASYGLKSRSYVDGPAGLLTSIRGRAEAQMRADDRVAGASAQVETSQYTSQGFVSVSVKPVGVGDLAKLKVPIALS